MGFDKCNALVVGLLREALVAQGRAALARLPAAERRGSTLLFSMGKLLKNMGKLEEARPLLKEDLQGNRETLGDRHPGTLRSVYNLAYLLENQGKITEAIPLFTEELKGCVSLHGMADKETRTSAKHLAKLLRNADQRDEAEALAAKYGV